MLVQILVDNPSSWIVPYAGKLKREVINLGHECSLIHHHEDVKPGDILCLLACEKIFKLLEFNRHNLVVHESDLPHGKGWSPVTWQVLEGKDRIPVTLFEASEKIDAGIIYQQDYIILEGHELLDEIKDKQGKITNNLIIDFIKRYPDINGREQVGDSTYYSRRGPEDSKLDPHKTIAEQFNLLRVVDNDRYPAYIELKGHKYLLKIEKIQS